MLDDYIRVRLPPLDTSESTGLHVFAATLKRYTSYSSWRELSSLSYGDPSTACSIVSSIEFDRDGEMFAVAGVTKKIKVLCTCSGITTTSYLSRSLIMPAF